MFFRSYLGDTTESTAAVRFVKAAVRIDAAHKAILLLLLVDRAPGRAEGIIDGITGCKRVFKAADCTNIATAAIILSNALRRVDTDFNPTVSLR